jgi:hypothetical protein
VRHETSSISGIKRRNISKTELMKLQQTVGTRTSETCIEEYINLRGATNLEIT